jgi:copper chaperone CopZ
MALIITTLIVKDMTCGGCEKAVERALKTVPGVVTVHASRSEEKVVVEHDAQTEAAQLRLAVERAGYTVF